MYNKYQLKDLSANELMNIFDFNTKKVFNII